MKITGHSAPHPEKPANVLKEIKSAPLVQSSQAAPSQKPAAAGLAGDSGPKILSNLIKALALPQDRLSASIIAFARFFSLPLDPGLLAKIRLTAKSGQAHTKARPEALALAAAAAADKGVELSPAGLEKYASALALDAEQQEEAGRRSGEDASKDAKKTDAKSPDIAALTNDPSELKEHILQTAEKDSLLGLLNRLPGRNGHRWAALPFNFSGQGPSEENEYRACLKVLLDGAGRSAGRMALDVTKLGSGNSPAQRRLFILTGSGGRDSESGKKFQTKGSRLQIYQSSNQGFEENLIAGLSERLEIPPEYINLAFFSTQNNINIFPFETDNDSVELFSVNEEA